MRGARPVLRANHSLKPEFNGLFCERIFGPVNDFECACGKKYANFQKPENLKLFCPNCNVEFTKSRVRRHRLGYIKLFNSVVHVWYLKGRPSYLSILLDFSRKQTESLAYCTESILNTIFPHTPSSIFDSCSESYYFIPNYRNLEKLKNNLFLHASNLIFTKKYLKEQKLQERKDNQNLKKKVKDHSLRNIHINIKVIQNIPKKFFNSFTLRSFLISNEYWKIQSQTCLMHPLKPRIGNGFSRLRYYLVSKYYGHFINSYSSISKYFCWEDPIKKAHFIYYMTSFPNKKDFLIFYYYRFFRPKVLARANATPQSGAQIFFILLKELSQTFKLEDRIGVAIKSILLLERQIRVDLFEMMEYSPFLSLEEMIQRVKLLRRLKLIWCFRLNINKPKWMILSILPVLPPDLRPIIQLAVNQMAISDLNKLYQRVLFRNQRIQRLKIGHYSNTSEESQYAQRLLQESVDSLIENGKGGIFPSSAGNGRPLKSLSDILKGKKGRFRQNLLGKRVDYSGRSVISAGPYLKTYECGIPREMAVELFQPFLIRRLILQKKAYTILGAKEFIQEGGQMVYEFISETIQNYPVLLNRAPTLHRLSIQSFQPKLVEGRAILLHPLVCAAFNADFDGDQMAVHIPLSYEARSEAWKLLWSQNSVLSPATGRPVLAPTQDIVLGWYYLTAIDLKRFYINFLKKTEQKANLPQIQQIFKIQKILNFYQLKVFKNSLHVFSAYDQNTITTHTPIWFYWRGFFEADKKCHPILEIRFNSTGNLFLFSYQFKIQYNWYGSKINQMICTTAGRVLLNHLTQ